MHCLLQGIQARRRALVQRALEDQPRPLSLRRVPRARDIVAEAERAAQKDIVAIGVKIKAEADRLFDGAKSKAACIEKRAQAALALAENIAEAVAALSLP